MRQRPPRRRGSASTSWTTAIGVLCTVVAVCVVTFAATVYVGKRIISVLRVPSVPVTFVTLIDPFSVENDTHFARLTGSVHFWHPEAQIVAYFAEGHAVKESWQSWRAITLESLRVPASIEESEEKNRDRNGRFARQLRAEAVRASTKHQAYIFLSSRTWLRARLPERLLTRMREDEYVLVDNGYLGVTEDYAEVAATAVSSVAPRSCAPSLDIFGAIGDSDAADVLIESMDFCVDSRCSDIPLSDDTLCALRGDAEKADDPSATDENRIIGVDADSSREHSKYCRWAASPLEEDSSSCAFLRPLQFVASSTGYVDEAAFRSARADRSNRNALLDRDEASIAILIPTTTRGMYLTSPWELPLFNVFLPSFLSMLGSCSSEFSYMIYLGYDAGDVFYDNLNVIVAIKDLFERIMEKHREIFNSGDDVAVTLKIYRSKGTSGAPCWLWNSLASAAYADGHDYFYQANDDLEFKTHCWSNYLVQPLRRQSSVRPNFGIVGPADRNNERVMTQSLVHRTHLDIFDGMYYPTVFKNWYSDNWANRVYGSRNTHLIREVVVENRQTAGTRYEVHDAIAFLDPELRSGRDAIAKWMKREGLRSYNEEEGAKEALDFDKAYFSSTTWPRVGEKMTSAMACFRQRLSDSVNPWGSDKWGRSLKQ